MISCPKVNALGMADRKTLYLIVAPKFQDQKSKEYTG